MHVLQSAPVAPGLRNFVRAYAEREITRVGSDLVLPVPASLEQVLEFEFASPPVIEYCDGTQQSSHRISVVGAHTQPGINVRLNGRIQSFAIFFQPWGMWQLFRVPANELPDRTYSGGELLGKEIDELWLQMAECASFEARVATVERFLLERAAKASGRTPIMQAAVHLFQRRGICRIDELAHHSGLSVRHFERRFSSALGMTPKRFARITRFQMALDAKLHSPHRSWRMIAYDFGYHDQMHMIRDFQSLSGASPERFLTELGDTRPPALAASLSD